MTEPTKPTGTGSSEPSEIDLERWAIQLIKAISSSMDSDRVDPRKWWQRLRTALERASRTGRSWSHMVSVMAKQCQIDALKPGSANSICSLEQPAADAGLFERFRRVCERDALYLVAMAEAERQVERADYKAGNPAKHDPTDHDTGTDGADWLTGDGSK